MKSFFIEIMDFSFSFPFLKSKNMCPTERRDKSYT